jgi:formylglycine-generating enzyme required for sulfatase activity
MGYVQNEFRLALNALAQRPQEQVYLIPVRLEECRVPELRDPDLGLSMGNHHWVDLFAENGLDRLVQALTDGARITPSANAQLGTFVPGQVFRDIDEPWCPEMVVIPAGRFAMGSPPNEEGRIPHEGPQHLVTIAEPFALGRYPVTFEEYDEFAATTSREPSCDAGWGRGRRPVINVSWQDAEAYVACLSQQTGQPYRLPSEAEWEYTCRAGTTTPFYFGRTVSTDQANYNGTVAYGPGRKGVDRQQTVPVGYFLANAFGLHDMHGNVAELCADVWHDSYTGAPSDGSAWLDGVNQAERVMRGGGYSWFPYTLRCAFRLSVGLHLPSSWRLHGIPSAQGFRVARTLR